MTVFEEDVKHVLSKAFGLILYDIRTGGGKRESFLKQSLAFHPHDLLINDENDHEIRGFLLLLVPCLKTSPAGLTLDRICDIFKKIGKGHLVPRSSEEQDDLKAALRTTRRRREAKRRTSEFGSLLHYLIYAKDLGYLNIFIDANKGGNLDAIYIQAGQRLNIEFEQQLYMNQLNTLVMDGPLKRSLGIFFEA
uniref:Uncharacterized protein n=1 Tax=Babesia bovis TaxID=5865 RepID=S6AZR7_BABBO|nr:conserved hypothetical protein [Babesia bovis]